MKDKKRKRRRRGENEGRTEEGTERWDGPSQCDAQAADYKCPNAKQKQRSGTLG